MFSPTRMLQKMVMRRRICGNLKSMLKGQPICVDERRSGLDQRETILSLFGIGIRRRTKTSHSTDIIGKSLPWCVGMTERVVPIEESALESAIASERFVEYPTPRGIGQVAIDGADDVTWKGTADVMALHDPPCCEEFGKAVSHAIRIGRHTDHGRQLERHKVTKVNRRKTLKEFCQALFVTEMKRIEEHLW